MGIFKKTSTNVLELRRFQDDTTKAYPEDAAVTASIFDAVGVPVANAQGLALAKVGGTAGAATIYRAKVPHTVDPAAGIFSARIDAIMPNGERRRWVEIIRWED